MRAANLTGSVSRKAGGLYESVRRLVQSLDKSGVGVRVFGLADKYTGADVGAWSPVEVRALESSWPGQFGYSGQWRKGLEEYRPDITHTHGLWLYASVAARAYQRRYGTPHVISPHGMLERWALRNSSWKKRVAWWLYEGEHLGRANCLRALCEQEAEGFRAIGLRNTVAIIPNGVDLAQAEGNCCRLQVGGCSFEETNNVPELDGFSGRRVLLFLSRVHPKKGLINLLRAWKAVEAGKEWVLVIAGWDEAGHEAELKRLCAELGLRWSQAGDAAEGGPASAMGAAAADWASVFFVGGQFGSAKEWWYRNCEALILPSLSEGVPMAVLEAWSHSKPVLMTPECNLEVGFAAGAATRLEGSVDGISRGLRELFATSRQELAGMGERGRRLVERDYCWERVAGQMAELYGWLVGGGARPGFVRPGR